MGDSLTFEQKMALALAQQPPGWEPFAAPLQAVYDYHTPVYRQPSAADMALAAELQKLRAQLADDYAARTNEAVKDRLGAAANFQQALTSMAGAIADNNQASAQVKAEQVRGVAAIRQISEQHAQNARYLAVENRTAIDAGNTQMQTDLDGAVVEAQKKPDPSAWLAQGDRLADQLAQQAATAINGQSGVTGKGGAYRTMSTSATNAINAYVGQSGLPPEQQAQMRQAMTERYLAGTAAVRPPEDLLVELNNQANADAANSMKMIREAGAQYSIPREIMDPFVEAQAKFDRWYDPSDPNAMNQLAMSASNFATEPIQQSLAQLDAQIDSLTTSTGDPFYESVAAFQETHPWYETWRRASGFRNHEEAMRWLVNHAEADRGGIVERLDTMWDSKTPEERASITVTDMQRELQDVREARKAEVQDQREAARQIGERPDRGGMRGYQTTKMGRALDEIAGMFRRDPGANPLPEGGMGSSSVVSVAEQTPGYRAYTPKMEEAGRPTYSGKPGEGPSSPRGYPAAPMYRGQGQDAGDAGAGASGSGGPQQGLVGAKPEQEASIRQRVESRLRRAGRGYTFGDYLDNEVMGRVA